jgi:hypothetical protein
VYNGRERSKRVDETDIMTIGTGPHQEYLMSQDYPTDIIIERGAEHDLNRAKD